MKFTTESGTVYEHDEVTKRVRRLGGDGMRRDGEWIQLIGGITVEVGQRVFMMLEPLGEGDYTFRSTTPVVEIQP